MKALETEQLRGNWATVILAWNRDESLDRGRVAAQIDALIDMGVDGIYCFGSACEFHAVDDDEFERVAALLAEKCDGAGMPFQIGVSHMSATTALARLRRIRGLAPGAIQVTLPDWFPPADEEVVAFLERMLAEADGVGLVLYNPPHAKRVLDWETLGRLADRFPRLLGVKVADGGEDWYAEMRAHRRHLRVFVPGHHLATGLKGGAHGSYSNMACLHPGAAQRWSDAAASGDPAAVELEGRIRDFVMDYIVPLLRERHYCDAAADRLLAQIGAWADVGEYMRWPYRPIPAAEAERLRPFAREALPEFFPG